MQVNKCGDPDYGACLQTGGGIAGDFQSLLERVDQKEHEKPDGERQHELEAAPAHSPQRGEEHQAKRNGHNADEEPHDAVGQQVAPG
jgi:hypothetical protein